MALHGWVLPSLTHLQYLVLTCLGGREMSGRSLRSLLKKDDISKTLPAFYQLMSRLEDAGFVEGRYVQNEQDGVMLTERHYRISADGIKARSAAYAFYLANGPCSAQPLPA